MQKKDSSSLSYLCLLKYHHYLSSTVGAVSRPGLEELFCTGGHHRTHPSPHTRHCMKWRAQPWHWVSSAHTSPAAGRSCHRGAQGRLKPPSSFSASVTRAAKTLSVCQRAFWSPCHPPCCKVLCSATVRLFLRLPKRIIKSSGHPTRPVPNLILAAFCCLISLTFSPALPCSVLTPDKPFNLLSSLKS